MKRQGEQGPHEEFRKDAEKGDEGLVVFYLVFLHCGYFVFLKSLLHDRKLENWEFFVEAREQRVVE